MDSDHLQLEESALQLYQPPPLPSYLYSQLLHQVGGLDHYELSKILHTNDLAHVYQPLATLTCMEAVDYLKALEENEPEQALVLYRDIIKEQLEAFVNKRKNIFAALKMDIEDRGNIQSFSQNFFVTEVAEEIEEDIQDNDYVPLQMAEDLVIESSMNITQSGIIPPEAHKYMKMTNSMLQTNKERVSKFNNVIQQPENPNDCIEEEIPEEVIDESPGNFVNQSNVVLDSFVTKTSESEHFDKNMIFEVPLQTDNLDKTRVVIPRGCFTSHNQAEIVIDESIDERIVESPQFGGVPNQIEDSLDTFQRSDSISMTQTFVLNRNNKSNPLSILEETKEQRAKLKSESIRKQFALLQVNNPPLNLSKFQIIQPSSNLSTIRSNGPTEEQSSIQDPSHQKGNLNDSLDEGYNSQDELDAYMKSNEHVKINKLKLIGSGTQADVYTCTVKSLIGGAAQYSGEATYVTKTKKIVDNFEIANDTFKSMYKEFKIAKNLKHPNVVRYMDFITKKSEKLCEFNIILEFLEGGNLRQFIVANQNKLSNQQIKEIIYQILCGLEYLHSKNIVHQDLKPQNILFDREIKTLKLADLGVSNILDRTKPTLSANCGTIRYMSPEQLDGLLTSKVDIWALGCVIMEMITGQPPYPDVGNEFQISRFIADKKINPREYYEKVKKQKLALDPSLSIILNECLQRDYQKRLSAHEILQLPYFS